jgi:hypothetical protein
MDQVLHWGDRGRLASVVQALAAGDGFVPWQGEGMPARHAEQGGADPEGAATGRAVTMAPMA